MRDLIGRKIGPYEIRDLIAGGGMAVVYRAFQPSLNRDVAIKILRTSLADDDEFVQRFQREAMSAGALKHPNVLRIYDAGTHEGQHYIVMDYAPGGTLTKRMEAGPLSVDEAVNLAIQIAEALDYAHARRIVHRDLKPSNILMDEDGRPLLADFGIAHIMSSEHRLTQVGTSLGTPEYMSPEQSEGLPLDGRTDIYSLGIMLYQMVTGRVPFQANTPVGTMYQLVHNAPAPPHEFNPDVPDYVESVILRSLAKNPADRFATAKEMAQALRERRVVPLAQAEPSAREETQVFAPRPGKAAPRPAYPPPSGRMATPVRPVAAAPAPRGGPRGLTMALIGVAVLALFGGAGYFARDLIFPAPSAQANLATGPGRASATLVNTRSPAPTSTETAPPTATRAQVAGGLVTAVPGGSGALPANSPVPSPVSSPAPTATKPPAPTASPSATLPPTRTPAPTAPPPTATPVPVPPTPTRPPVATLPPAPPPTATLPPAPPAAAVGGRIVFPMLREGRQDIMALDAATGKTWQVFAWGSAPTCAAMVAVVFNGIGGGRDNLIALSVGGGPETYMSNHPEDSYPSWSPSGQTLVYHSAFQGGQDSLYILAESARNSEPTQRLQISGKDILGRFPVWLGNWRIAFSGCGYQWGQGNWCGIWSINSSGDLGPARLTDNPNDHATDAAAGQLLFARQDGNWEVYSVPENGGGARNLTNSPSSQDFGASMSPDGRNIAYMSNRDGWSIWVMNADGSNQRKLLAVPGGFSGNWADEKLSWGP